MKINKKDIEDYLKKWQKVLRLQDWDIKYQSIDKEWRKTGDIKIDDDDRTAILLINTNNPKQTNLEQLIIHELLHLKLWEIDRLTVDLIDNIFDKKDPKRELVFSQFMHMLEYIVNDLSKSLLELGGINKTVSFGRLETQLKEEFGCELSNNE